MLIKGKKYLFALLIAGLAITSNPAVLADTAPVPLTQTEKTQLEQQLKEIESQIAQYQQQLSQIQGQKNTLQNKVNQLKKQQASLNLQIQATNLQLTALAQQLILTQTTIDQNVAKTKQLKTQTAEFIRLAYQQDDYSLLYILLSQNNLSDIVSELENYSQVSDSLRALLNQIKDANVQLEQQQEVFTQPQEDTNNLRSIQNLQQQQLSGAANQQKSLLAETKGQESTYQNIITDTQKQANAIRSRLYQLLGISTQITFGQAVTIAQWAGSQTGVRASFLLAILTQESNLGKNVGTCNRPGDPPEKSWKVIMKPDRDQTPFAQITADLGMDPDTTPVSCPMRDSRGKRVGWGGAMGPAQFIPSTWMGYKDKVAALTGKTANPWDIRDAFLAAAIKLKAGGAGTVDGEWAAAMRYFSGGTNTKYRFYGDNVVAMAAQYQNDINNLGQ
jgi:peptidoglycan hydrolase CwlO-like protein